LWVLADEKLVILFREIRFVVLSGSALLREHRDRRLLFAALLSEVAYLLTECLVVILERAQFFGCLLAQLSEL